MSRILIAAIIAVSLGAASLGGAAWAAGKDSYYYPPVDSEEVFARDLTTAPPADRAVRVGFTTQITKAQLAAPESPRFVIFAKGDEARQMIIVALDDQVFRTIYRARAVLAQLTSNVRGAEMFINKIEAHATWLKCSSIVSHANPHGISSVSPVFWRWPPRSFSPRRSRHSPMPNMPALSLTPKPARRSTQATPTRRGIRPR